MEKDKNNYSGTVWNTIGVALNSFLSFFFLITVTRINGIEESGNFSFLFTVSLLLFTISTYGGRVYQVSDEIREFEFQNYLTSKFYSSVFALIIMFLFMVLNGYNMSLMLMLLFLFGGRVVETFSDVYYGVFQRNNHLDYVGISMTLKSLISIIMFFIIDVLTYDVVLSTLSLPIANTFVFIFYDYRLLKKYQSVEFDFSNKTIKVIKVTKYIFLFNFLTILIINIPRYMVDIFLDQKAQGYFGIIIMIPTVLSLFGQFIIQPSLVKLSKYYNERKLYEYLKILKLSIFTVVILSVLCMTCAYFLGPQVLGILYGIDFKDYRLTLLLAILGGTFNVFTSIISVNLTVMRETKKQFLFYLITFLLGTILSYYIISKLKMDGVFLSYLLTMFIQFILFLGLFSYKFKQNKKAK